MNLLSICSSCFLIGQEVFLPAFGYLCQKAMTCSEVRAKVFSILPSFHSLIHLDLMLYIHQCLFFFFFVVFFCLKLCNAFYLQTCASL